MFFTPNFVFVHMPKNAGSFVEAVLRQTYGKRGVLPWIYEHTGAPLLRKVENRERFCFRTVRLQMATRGFAEVLIHGHCTSLPKMYGTQTILGVLRDPLDRYISEYEFRWWALAGRQHPFHAEIVAEFPGWPDKHSFVDEVELRHRFHTRWQTDLSPEERVGIQTEHFIRFFCRAPRTLLRKGKNLTAKEICADLYPLHFISMKNVNAGLAQFLKIQGCSPDQCQRAESHKRVLPDGRGRKQHDNISEYFTPRLRQITEERENLLLQIWHRVEAGDTTAQSLQAQFA